MTKEIAKIPVEEIVVSGGKRPKSSLRVLLTSDTHRGFTDKTAMIHEKWGSKIAALDFDVLVVAGDLATNRKKQFYAALAFYRKVAGDRPVLIVRGNHDIQEATYSNHFQEWKVRQNSLLSLYAQHSEWFKELNIHHLEEAPFEKNGVVFVGWDGWYQESQLMIEEAVKTHNQLILAKAGNNQKDQESPWGFPNDHLKIPPLTNGKDTFDWLRERAEASFEKALGFDVSAKKEEPSRKIIAVTHFPPFVKSKQDDTTNGSPLHLQRLSGTADILLYGHSHERLDEMMHGVRLINCGSDYDQPSYVLIDV